MKKLLLVAIAVLFVVPAASAAFSVYSWEDGGTVLGVYGNPEDPAYPAVIATNVGAPDPVHSPTRSLKLVDNGNIAAGTTPQAYICHVYPLTGGDVVEACVWIYDTTPGASPSGRIWAHYTGVGEDCEGYAGSAGGNSDYGPGTGWHQVCHTWVFDSDGGTRDGLCIHIRTYSLPGDTIWVDSLEVTHPDGTYACFPGCPSPVETQSWSLIKAMYR